MHPVVISNLPIRIGGNESGWTYYLYAPIRRASRPKFIAPLPYRFHEVFGNDVGSTLPISYYQGFASCSGHVLAKNTFNGFHIDGGTDASLYNTAHARLVNRLSGAEPGSSTRAELGTTLLEYNKSADFVSRNLEAVRDYTLAVYRGQNPEIARARERLRSLRRKKNRRDLHLRPELRRRLLLERWRVPRWLSSRWLEYWMCVAPTIGDVHTSLAILARDVQIGYVYGTCTNRNYKKRWYSSFSKDITEEHVSMYLSTRVGAHFTLVNQNTRLAQELGLLNPLTVVGELLPWTWLIGWFVNWKQVLGAWTAFAGYSVKYPYVTRFNRYQGQRHRIRGNSEPKGTLVNNYEGAIVYRTTPVSLPFPTLRAELPGKLLISQAATSMSLVVNLLTAKG